MTDAIDIDDIMGAYAAGQLTSPLHVLVASHLALSKKNRPFVGALETLLSDSVGQIAPVALNNPARMMDAIFAQENLHTDQPSFASDPVLPKPLQTYLGQGLDTVNWRRILPHAREFSIEHQGQEEVNLYWINAGKAMPAHTHEGFSDATGHYKRGDIAIADASVDHRPRAGMEEDCICFAVTSAPLRLTGPIGRLIQPFLRH
jgi:putative transcriptional regulator